MKQIISVLFATLLTISITSCTGGSANTDSDISSMPTNLSVSVPSSL